MKYSSSLKSAFLYCNVPKCVQVSPGTFAALWEAGLRKPMQMADTQNVRQKLSFFTGLIDDLTDLMSAPTPINCGNLIACKQHLRPSPVLHSSYGDIHQHAFNQKELIPFLFGKNGFTNRHVLLN